MIMYTMSLFVLNSCLLFGIQSVAYSAKFRPLNTRASEGTSLSWHIFHTFRRVTILSHERNNTRNITLDMCPNLSPCKFFLNCERAFSNLLCALFCLALMHPTQVFVKSLNMDEIICLFSTLGLSQS